MLRSLSLIHDQELFGNVKGIKERPDEAIMVTVDRPQSNQVFINLAMNAGWVSAPKRPGKLKSRATAFALPLSAPPSKSSASRPRQTPHFSKQVFT